MNATNQITNPAASVIPARASTKAAAAAQNPHLPRLAYSIKEVGVMLGLSYPSVYRLVGKGLLKSSDALRHKLIPASEIERFLKS
jgi:excisionase family DNA binding protein